VRWHSPFSLSRARSRRSWRGPRPARHRAERRRRSAPSGSPTTAPARSPESTRARTASRGDPAAPRDLLADARLGGALGRELRARDAHACRAAQRPHPLGASWCDTLRDSPGLRADLGDDVGGGDARRGRTAHAADPPPDERRAATGRAPGGRRSCLGRLRPLGHTRRSSAPCTRASCRAPSRRSAASSRSKASTSSCGLTSASPGLPNAVRRSGCAARLRASRSPRCRPSSRARRSRRRRRMSRSR